MPGPRPDDSYNPLQTEAPTGAPQGDSLSVRANPNQFGAQVGQSVQGLGKTGEDVGNKLMASALQEQGLANEHAANQAEMDLAVKGGEVYNKYKNLEGLDASNARPQAIQEYLKVNQQIREGLTNPASQKAYDQLATRRMSFTIQDMNSYAAEQQKHAYRQGNIDLAQVSIDRASTYAVAMDPKQLNFEKGNVIFQANAAYTAPSYGRYQTVPAKTNAKTGMVQFDTSTQQGKVAQADYDNYLDKQLGAMYENATKIIAFDPKHGNVSDAVNFLEDNKDNMRPATYARLSATLHGPYQNEQSRELTDNILQSARHNYEYSSTGADEHGTVYATNLGNVTIHGGAFANPTTPVDGATLAANNLRSDIYKGKTLAQIADTWTTTDKATWLKNVSETSKIDPSVVPDVNNPQVLKALLSGINVAEKAPGDRAAFNDQVLDQGVKNSLSGVKANLSPGRPTAMNGQVHQSWADYLNDNESNLIEQARTTAKNNDGDTVAQDLAAQRMQSRVAEARSSQAAEVHSIRNSVYAKVMDDKHPITNMAYLDNSGDPEVKANWTRLQFLDPYAAGSIQRVVAANANGRSNTYGTDFYSHYNDVLTGKVTDTAQLQDYFGGDKSPISNTGIRVLSQAEEDMKTPEGRGFRHAESQFLEKVHGQVTGTKVFPGINPAILKDGFDKQLMELIPQIEAKRADLIKQGKNPTDMFDENNKPDYVGKNIKPLDFDKGMKALVTSSLSGSGKSISNVNPGATNISNPAPEKNVGYSTIEDVGNAWKSGKITQIEAYDIVNKQFGGFAPAVPKPQ